MDHKALVAQFEPIVDGQPIVAEPQVRAARYSPCGQFLVAGGLDARVRRWGHVANAWSELPSLEGHHGWVDGLAFEAEEKLLFTADSWGQLRCMRDYAAAVPTTVWCQPTAHDGWVRSLAMNSEGQLLASCGSDRVCRVWSATEGKPRYCLADYGRDLYRVIFAPDGTLLTGDDRGLVKQWSLDGTLVREFDASVLFAVSRLQDVGGVQCLAIDRKGERLAVGGVTPKNGGTVVGVPTLLVFDMATGAVQQQWKLGVDNDCFVADVHFHDAGFLSLVTYGTPGQGQLIYLAMGEASPLFTKKLTNPQSLSWHPDAQRLAIVTTNSGSNGNGRPLTKDGAYKTNQSPIHLFRVAGQKQPA